MSTRSKHADKTHLQKIIYIACIGGLLIPLAMVSRPEVRDESRSITDGGGVLARLREENDLSQAKMSEVDPVSETMKLASLGLRGVAVNALWMQAIEHKKREEYDKLAATLQTLTKIQPNFVKVWEYQAHNLAYNVSMEFDDYEYRYEWVTKGLDFLKDGIPYNKSDHRMTDSLGFMTGNKMGKSDEKIQFRRMFRKDNDFHGLMSDLVDPELYDDPDYGFDSWQLAWQFYDISRDLVEQQSQRQYKSDLMFKMYRPSQRRNQALTLADEFETDEAIQGIWGDAAEQWIGYGNEPLTNSLGVTFTLERIEQYEQQIEDLQRQLDELVPAGTREERELVRQDELNLTEDEQALLDMPADQRDDQSELAAQTLMRAINTHDRDFDLKIAMEATEANQLEAKRIAGEIRQAIQQIEAAMRDGTTVNYTFWKDRNKAESEDAAVRARQAIFRAQAMQRRSIYDDEYELDYKTGEKKVTLQGATSLYVEGFAKWKELLDEYPSLLLDGPLSDDLADYMHQYQELLKISGLEWPDDFPLQGLVDARFEDREPDELPTSEDLAERRSARGEE